MASNKPIYQLYPAFLINQFLGRKIAACIDVTDKCNLNCGYCYHKNRMGGDKDVPLTVFRKRFSEYNKRGIKIVAFVGGEPSLRLDVLQLAEKYFPFISVFTNGLVKIPNEFDRRIVLSLNGLCLEHEKMKNANSFDKIVANYAGDRRVVIVCILSTLNYAGPERLRKYIDFVRQMKWSALKIEYYIPQLGKNPDPLELTQKQLDEITEILLQELERRDSILLATPSSLGFQRSVSGMSRNCCLSDGNFNIKTDGTLKKCVGEYNDCLRCRNEGKYSPPVYNFFEWYKLKKIRRKLIMMQ